MFQSVDEKRVFASLSKQTLLRSNYPYYQCSSFGVCLHWLTLPNSSVLNTLDSLLPTESYLFQLLCRETRRFSFLFWRIISIRHLMVGRIKSKPWQRIMDCLCYLSLSNMPFLQDHWNRLGAKFFTHIGMLLWFQTWFHSLCQQILSWLSAQGKYLHCLNHKA